MKDKRVYVERRPEGDYAVRRANSERASDVLRTQRDAIERARELSEKLQKRLAEIDAKIQAAPRPRVLVILSTEPLITVGGSPAPAQSREG